MHEKHKVDEERTLAEKAERKKVKWTRGWKRVSSDHEETIGTNCLRHNVQSTGGFGCGCGCCQNALKA